MAKDAIGSLYWTDGNKMCTELKPYKDKQGNSFEPVTESFKKYLPHFEQDYYEVLPIVEKMLDG